MMKASRIAFVILCLGLLAAFSNENAHAAIQATTFTINNPYCTQLLPSTGTCTINIRSISASDPSLSHLEIIVNGKVRAFVSTFFETSLTLNENMVPRGIQVPCGRPNASNIPTLGLQYSVGLTLYTTGSPAITDTANVICPAFKSRTYIPVVRR